MLKAPPPRDSGNDFCRLSFSDIQKETTSFIHYAPKKAKLGYFNF